MLGARGPRLEIVADASFLTEPVSCEVSNAVGSANRSTALDVLCEPGRGRGVAKVGWVQCAGDPGGNGEWDPGRLQAELVSARFVPKWAGCCGRGHAKMLLSLGQGVYFSLLCDPFFPFP